MKQLQLVSFTLAALLLGLVSASWAEINVLKGETHQLSIYGWIKLDATYQGDDMNSKVAPRFATGDGAEGTNFTAMHSRFGLKWAGPEMVHGYKAAGVLEFDLFDGSTNNNMDFRTRLIAFTLSNETSTWLFGQHWDIFSPLNPTTLMTNGNLWQTGNLGARRAQARYAYKSSGWEFAASINDPSTSGSTSDTDFPLLEGRVGLEYSGAKFGISGNWGRDETTVSSVDSDIWGVSADWVVPIASSFSLKGELATGENLGVFMSRAKVNKVTGEEQEVVSGWTELVYSGADFNWWIGGAFENPDDIQSGSIEDSWMSFAGGQYKFKTAVPGGKPILFGAEVATFESDIAGGGDNDAAQLILSAQYNF